MQISLKWINEIINIQNINLDYLIEKLTLAGFEVEDIIEVEENNGKSDLHHYFSSGFLCQACRSDYRIGRRKDHRTRKS